MDTGNDYGPRLPGNGSVVAAFGGQRVQLREPATEPAAPVERPNSSEIPDFIPDGLSLHGEIARGGMGAVLKGRDTELGRDIAVKVLLETHQGRTELVQRFIEEAQIAGQLQHPGVVPVYELGRFADHRPYFTMKLVKGQTLAKLLAERKLEPAALTAGYVGRIPGASLRQPAAGSPSDLPCLLGIFLDVCQTIAYAHARGVIHRDLKPSNVMVGNFGEVQVMDWGLAKVLKEGGVADEHAGRARSQALTISFVQTQRNQGSGTADGDSDTRAGSVLGTPAYMAPEQARGEVELVDERADVFGLGAILCQILTGEPPFTGKSPEAQRKAQTASLDDAYARLERCGADAELTVLAKRCLAAEPWDRPRHAGEVRSAITAYLEGVETRLRRAELDRAAAQVKVAEERKRRKLLLALASSVLAVVIVGAAGGLWVQHIEAERRADRTRQEGEQRQAVESALDKVAVLQKGARWKEAEAVLEQARGRLGLSGPEDLFQRVERSQTDLAMVARLDSIRQNRRAVVEGKYDETAADREYEAAFREMGLGVESGDAETVAERIRASAIREPLVAAVDDWALVPGRDTRPMAWLLEVGRRADPSELRERFCDPKVRENKAAMEALAAELLGDETRLSKLNPQLLAALAVAVRKAQGNPIPLLRSARASHPNDFWLSFTLGVEAVRSQQQDEAVSCYRAAVALRPESAAAHNNLGLVLRRKNLLDEAIREYRTAAKLEPKFALPHINLSNALLFFKNQPDEAIQEARIAVQLDPDLAVGHEALGNCLAAKNLTDEAIREFQLGINLDPNSARLHYNLGKTFQEMKRPDEAIKEYSTAIQLDPKFAIAHNSLGNVLRDKHRLDDAIREFRAAIAIDTRMAGVHNNLGGALMSKGQLNEAVTEFQTAVKLEPGYARAHAALGGILFQLGRFAEARDTVRRCLNLLPANDSLRQPTNWLLEQCEQGLALDRLLAAVVAISEQPVNDADRLELARHAQESFHKRYAVSVRLYTEAFDHDPKMLEDLNKQYRYNAACAAALAGSGRDARNSDLNDAQRDKMRQQALAWLRADLAAWTKLADNTKEHTRIRRTLQHRLQDTDLASVRDPKEVVKLPSEEQEAWKKLWADTAELLEKVQEKK
jgi:serine/threonine-protein kinase